VWRSKYADDNSNLARRVVLDRLAVAGRQRFLVRDLAQSVNLSASRFSNLFALATDGVTPGRYMKRHNEVIVRTGARRRY
jgi:transcriptional regulator GlxA family with amidase domain